MKDQKLAGAGKSQEKDAGNGTTAPHAKFQSGLRQAGTQIIGAPKKRKGSASKVADSTQGRKV